MESESDEPILGEAPSDEYDEQGQGTDEVGAGNGWERHATRCLAISNVMQRHYILIHIVSKIYFFNVVAT